MKHKFQRLTSKVVEINLGYGLHHIL